MRLGLLVLWGVALLGTFGCPTVPPAPKFGDDAGTEGEATAGGPQGLDVSCGSLSPSAEDALFEYTVLVSGQAPGATLFYSASGLPSGLSIDGSTGSISGTLEVSAGTYEFEVMVVEEPMATPAETAGDETGSAESAQSTTTCLLEVAPRFRAVLPADTEPYCLSGNQSLLSAIVPGTGDGSAVTCTFIGGDGNGRIPDGVDVDPESCSLVGTISESHLGAWAFVVEAEQSGVKAHVPFCVANDVSQQYEISVDHSGATDATLVPMTRFYDPTADFSVGSDGDPRVTILDPSACGASCFYRYTFNRTNAPFDGASFTLEPDGLIQDEVTMAPIGLFHELRLSGGPSDLEGFHDRPWVLSVEAVYCLSASDTECNDVLAASGGALELSLIMVPSA